MNRFARRVITVVAALAAALSALTHPNASFTPALAAAYVTGNLTYNNGAVMPNPTNYVIFWLPTGTHFEASAGADGTYENLVGQYFTDMCKGNALYNTMTQYSTNGGATVTGGPIQNNCTYGGSYVDSTNYATSGAADTTNAVQLSDLTGAVDRAITHFNSGTGTNVEYFVYLGYQINYCRSSTFCSFATDSNNGFCAYHSTYTSSAHNNNLVTYAINSSGINGCSAANGSGKTPNNDVVADSTIDVTSHEQFESVTNPNNGGWFFGDGSHENGDECNFNFGSADTNTDGTNFILNGDKYRLQWEWSNVLGANQTTPPAPADFGSSGCGPSYPGGGFCASSDNVCPASPTLSLSATPSIEGNTGDDVTYTLKYGNTSGTDGVYSPSIQITLPNSFSYSSTSGCGLTPTTTGGGQVVTYSPGALGVGSSCTVTFHAQLTGALLDGSTNTAQAKLTGKDQLGTALSEVDSSASTGVDNPAPTLDTVASQSVDFNDPLSFTVVSHDGDLGPDPDLGNDTGDTFTMSATGLPAGLTATDNGDGTMTISGTPTADPGTYTATVAVDDHHHTSPVTENVSITINKEESSVSSTNKLQVLASASSINLSATLTDPDGGAPIGGKSVTITLGSGAGAVSCTGTSDTLTGVATCPVTPTSALLGPQPISDSFAGDTDYKAATPYAQTALVFSFLKSGTFVLGDKTASNALATTPTPTVTWWGSQWYKLNALFSGATLPSAMKGFGATLNAEPPVCGGNYTTVTGNSPPPPPATTIPSYMGVAVSSGVTMSGSTISGNITSIVVVKTNTGYQPDPSHPGTGTVIATFCHT